MRGLEESTGISKSEVSSALKRCFAVGLAKPERKTNGTDSGQSVEPLFKTVPKAIAQDKNLYAMLALVDAIRLGNEREASLARKMLQQFLRGEPT